MSKDARADEKDAASPAKKSPQQQGKTQKEASPPKGPKPDAPPITTLLEFIAWLALQWTGEDSSEGVLKSRGSGFGWVNGRGGFLADEMESVQDASIRLQVNQRPTSNAHESYA